MMLMQHRDAARLRRRATSARPGSTSPAGSAAARRRRTSARSFSGCTRSSSRSIQSPTRAGRLERHLVGELVVVAVVALEAVVAGEVALQRRQHRDVQLGRVALDRGRGTSSSARAIGVAARRRGSRCPRAASSASRSSVGRVADELAARRAAIEQRRDVARHHQLRVGERVHQEHFVARRRAAHEG